MSITKTVTVDESTLVDGDIPVWNGTTKSFDSILGGGGGGGPLSLTGDATGTTSSVVNTQARGLKSATTTVSVSAAAAPTSGQVLTATAGTTATWQAAASAARQSVVFKPGVASSGGVVATWAEVAALIVSTEGRLDVYVDSTLATPTVSSNIDCKGKTNFIGVIQYNYASGQQTILAITPGVVITDPTLFKNLNLQGSGNDLMVHVTVYALVLNFVNSIIQVPTNNVPAVLISSDNAIITLDGSAIYGGFPATDSYFEAESGIVIYFTLQLLRAYGLFSAPDNALMVKGTSIVCNMNTDGSAYLPPQTNLVTSTEPLLLTGYTTQSGTSANRPTSPLFVGQQYFDITISSPIWWDGAAWIDGPPATGSAGGDLAGTYPNPTLAKLQGKTLASSLSSVGATQDGYALTWVNGSNDWEARPVSGAGGGGTPGGSNTQVQFNDSSAFGGDAGLTYNKTSNVLTLTSGALVLSSTGGAVSATGDIRGESAISIKHVVGGVDRQLIAGDSSADTFVGDPTNGGSVYLRASSQPVVVQIGGVDQLRITSTNTTTSTATTTWGIASSGLVSMAPMTPLATTDATVTTILTYAIPASTMVDFQITVCGIRTGGTSGTAGDCYRAELPVTYQRIGAAAPTLVGAAYALLGAKSVGGGSAYLPSLVISGNNLLVQVKGVANNNIDWTAVCQGQQVA